MTKFLGIDYGIERTGLALSDPGGKVVFPLCTLNLKDCGSRKNLLDILVRHAIMENIDEIVLGLPLNEDNSESLTSIQVRNFAKRLKRRITIPIYFMPELLSSADAKSELQSIGVKGKKLKNVLDQQAACKILASFLCQPEHKRCLA